VPASGFYEWKREGDRRQPYFIARKDGRPMALAGLWDRWTGQGAQLESCAILTTDANERVRPIHERMPVIISSELFDRWLDPRNHDIGELRRLLGQPPAEPLVAYPVSSLVNKPENDSPACIEPIRETPRARQQALW
jgi:putative SOS response-associated peptidase YedK